MSRLSGEEARRYAAWHLLRVFFEDLEQWRAIARENGIMNPLDVAPGQKIKLPAL